jgi:YbgC/YbaW family acyl-CoA thioester hydrolase
MKDVFNFSIPYTIRVNELDYMGRVSQASVLNIFQEARIEYLAHIGDYTELDIGDGCGLIQNEAKISFINDMHQGDALKINARVSEVRGASFIMSYQIHKGEVLMAEGETTLLAMDYTSRKPRRLPASFKKAMAEFEAEKPAS